MKLIHHRQHDEVVFRERAGRLFLVRGGENELVRLLHDVAHGRVPSAEGEVAQADFPGEAAQFIDDENAGERFSVIAVAAQKRLKDAPDVPTFAERGYEFYWEQMRGVVGPANMDPAAVKWWQDTLRKVVGTKKWQEQYIKRNLLTPTDWTGDEANKYLDGLNSKYEQAIKSLKASAK